MRKVFLMLASLVSLTGMSAAPGAVGFHLPPNYDPMNLNFKYSHEELTNSKNSMQFARKKSVGVKATADNSDERTIEMYVATQSFYKDYTFVYTGGDIDSYSITLTVTGDQVKISNFLNIEAHSTEAVQGGDEDIYGIYDEKTNTITIPTPNSVDGTVVGWWGAFINILISGTVTETGALYPTEELILNVEGDFDGLYTDQNFGPMNFAPNSGEAWGFQTVYRQFIANGDFSTPKLVAFNEAYGFGHTYPNTPVEFIWPIVNISGVNSDYAIDLPAGGNAFYVTSAAGVCPGKSLMDVTVGFSTEEVGNYEGIVSLQYENDTDETLDLAVTGEIIPLPDFSPIVAAGEFTFGTSIDYPFEISALTDGTEIARSTINGFAGTSWLEVEFDVPEGHQIGVLSWKGESTATYYWYGNTSCLYVDDLTTPVYTTPIGNDVEDFSNSLQLAPGHHKVRFQYNSYRYSGATDDGLYIYDLNLEMKEVPDHDVVVETPELRFGNYILHDDYPCEGTQTLVLRNKGYELLKVLDISFDNEAYSASVPNTQAPLLSSILIPVNFKCSEAGKINGKITVSTTAGDVTADLVASVYPEPDFMSVVTEGKEYINSITTSDVNPFIVEDGVAYNANAGEPDDTYSSSLISFNFTIPDGLLGHLSWEGIISGSDYCIVYFYRPDYNNGLYFISGQTGNASSEFFANQEYWRDFLVCVPGDYTVSFEYIKGGDGVISGDDILKIWDFQINTEECPAHACEPDTDEVVFSDPIYIGADRYVTSTVILRNTGLEPLQVLSCTDDVPFSGIFDPNATAAFGKELTVEVKFYPEEEGDFWGEVTFHTNAGDINISCFGETKSSDGVLLIGDFEDLAYDWLAYDADGDGICWKLGTYLWGDDPQWSHSGNNSMGSPSFDLSTWTPVSTDDWLISPSFVVPENGAMLEWFVANFDSNRYAEHYSVYILPASVRQNVETVTELASDTTPICEETLPEMSSFDWREMSVSLEAYANQEVCVVFRHNQEEGQYVLRLDDVMVYTMERWGQMSNIVGVSDRFGEEVSSEIFRLDGSKQSSLLPGVNIVRKTYSDGSVRTFKVMVK